MQINRAILLNVFKQLHVEQAVTTASIPAAVLIPIIDHATELTVLFTQRSEQLQKHRGQISFPGGAVEHIDENIVATALRETQEEIGIPTSNIQVLGSIGALPSVTGYHVTPVIGLITPPLHLQLQTTEVVSVFEVPLQFILNEKNYQHQSYEYQNKIYQIPEIFYEQHRIWGLTARILELFREVIFNNFKDL